jgi:prepilin-type N-terminal cleavage/methylation domain-containing protein
VRKAFTLLELLVVLTIITLVMGVVVPKGSKMLSSYEHSLDRMKDKQEISKMRATAFLQAKDEKLKLKDKEYKFTKKGIILEISNDNN